MADPVTLGVLVAASSAVAAVGQYETSNAQAKAEENQAASNSAWSERRQTEERAAAQRQAGEEQRKARLAESRLGAVAGASGSGSADPTIMNLYERIAGEGDYNAAQAKAAGEQRTAGLSYQSSLDRWSADTNARIRRYAATTTLISDLGKAGAGGAKTYYDSPMAKRYPSAAPSAGTGY